MKYFIFIILYISSFSGIFSQSNLQNINISFLPSYEQKLLRLAIEPFSTLNSDSLSISLFKCYVSNIQLVNQNQLVYKVPNSIFLINAADTNSFSKKLSIPINLKFDAIQFTIGIDSATNVSGALGGDLDPMKGMYWTWQSGYINLKLEGSSLKCASRNHSFEFHLGGYRYPFYNANTVVLPVSDRNRSIDVKMDIAKFLSNIDFSNQHHIMTPSKEAVMLNDLMAKACSIIE